MVGGNGGRHDGTEGGGSFRLPVQVAPVVLVVVTSANTNAYLGRQQGEIAPRLPYINARGPLKY